MHNLNNRLNRIGKRFKNMMRKNPKTHREEFEQFIEHEHNIIKEVRILYTEIEDMKDYMLLPSIPFEMVKVVSTLFIPILSIIISLFISGYSTITQVGLSSISKKLTDDEKIEGILSNIAIIPNLISYVLVIALLFLTAIIIIAMFSYYKRHMLKNILWYKNVFRSILKK